jgi:hypothetical protein
VIPLWFTIETPLSPAQVCERINKITHPAPTSFWRQFRLDWARDPFHGKRFAGQVDRVAGKFRIFNYLWGGGDRTFTVYDGRVESLGGKTKVRVTLALSSMLKIILTTVPLAFFVSFLIKPGTRIDLPGILIVVMMTVPVFTIVQVINCYKAEKLFIEILTTSATPVHSRRSSR